MFKGVKLGLCAMIAMGSMVSFAQQADDAWTLSLGVSFRSVNTVDFKGFDINGGNYLDGTPGDPLNPFDQVTNVGPGVLPPPFDLGAVAESYHRAAFSEGSADLSSGTGIILGLSRPIGDSRKDGNINLDLTFSYFTADTDEAINANVYTDVYYDGTFGGSTETGDLPPGGKGADVKINYNMALEFMTFGVGVSKTMQFDALDLKLGFGPTITMAHYDIERTTYQQFSTPTAGYNESAKDDGAEVLVGLYASADLIYNFNEKWGMFGGIRYDFVANKIESDIAEIDPSGFSVQLGATYRF